MLGERVFPRHLTWPHLLQGVMRVDLSPKVEGLMSLRWMWAPCRASLAVVAPAALLELELLLQREGQSLTQGHRDGE